MNGVRTRLVSAFAWCCMLLLIGCGGGSNSANTGNTGTSNGTPTTGSTNPGNTGGTNSGGSTGGTGTTGSSGSGTGGSGSGGTTSSSASATYLYAGTSINEGGIRGYKVDSSSGNLVEISGSPTNLPAGFTTGGLIVATKGFVYAVNRPAESGGSAIYTFKIDPATGVLTPQGNAVTVTSSNDADVRRMVVSPDGKTVYLVSQLAVTAVALNDGSPSKLNSINVTTGSTFGFGVANSRFSYVGVQDGNPKTGFAQPVIKAITLNSDGSLGMAQTVITLTDANIPYDLTVDAAGKYVAATTGFNNGEVGVWSIDAMTGALSPVPGSPFSNSGDIGKKLRFNPSGTQLYLVNNPDFEPRHEDVKVYNVGSDGALSLTQTVDLGTGEWVTDFVADNDFAYVANQTVSVQGNILVLRRDQSSGKLSTATTTPENSPPGGLGTVHF